MKPRDYQIEAVKLSGAALAASLRVLVVAPTASGKSVIIAAIIRQALEKNKTWRIMVLCHQGHLLTQNENKILQLMPWANTGVYCDGVDKRKEHYTQIVLASRDSLGRKPEVAGKFDLIIVDEAHSVPVKCGTEDDDTYYSRIFKAQKESYVIGLTATPWRTGNGLIYGKDCFFEELAYDIKMKLLVEQDYLSRPVFPEKQTTVINTSELKIIRGDFREADLIELSTPDHVIEECLDIWEREASDRKVSLFFCCSREHAKKVQRFIQKRICAVTEEVLYIDGDVTGADRKEKLKDIQDGKYKAIVNIGVLTTGFDAPIIDCIVFLRATASASLFVQMAGRGLRIMEGKDNCLMLDMAGNFERFGSIEDPYVKRPGKAKEMLDMLEEEQNAPLKLCPSCGEYIATGKTVCFCGHIFISHTSKLHTTGPEVHEITDFNVESVTTRKGEDCFVATYWIDMINNYREYLMINRTDSWAKKHINRFNQLTSGLWEPKLIEVTPGKNIKYPNIKIIKWDVVVGSDECRHTHIEKSLSPQGLKYTFCEDCQEFI